MYADVIVDISHKNLDRPFCYRIPDSLKESVAIGNKVSIPFGKGNTAKEGYVVGLSETPTDEIDADRIKEISAVIPNGFSAEENLIAPWRSSAWTRPIAARAWPPRWRPT